jgi:tRNA pseudouridine32 synthase/23S rRNA pseudouridine746 synthase
MTIAIIFENKDFCIADKPPGLLSVPSRKGTLDERPVLGTLLEKQMKHRVWPCHRLDLEVSGLVMFALNPEAHSSANKWFEDRSIKKAYQALSEYGATPPSTETVFWRSKLMRGKKRAYEAAFGKESKTEARCLGVYPHDNQKYLAWKLTPHTGRPHQLRYEMAKNVGPILGDSLYGSKTSHFHDGIALVAVSLDFTACSSAEKFGLPPLVYLNSERCFAPIR